MTENTTTNKTTKRKTSTIKTTATKKAETVEKESVNVVIKPEETTLAEAVKPARIIYKASDLIPCKSVRYGLLQHVSKKSGNNYEWSDYGDVCDVEYGDLLALKASKSVFIYQPWFLILDEDLQKAWKLEDLYSYFNNYDEAEDFLKQDIAKISQKLQNAPQGYKDVVRYTARKMLQDGTLDSISVVKTIDRILHTNLSMLLGG